MKVRFSLALLALLLPLSACELIMPEPEPPPKVILMLLPGFMEFDPPDVRIARGEQLILKRWPLLWDPDIGPFPELAPGQVLAPYRSFLPKVIRCTDVVRELHVFPVPCPMQADLYRPLRPDTLIRVDESMMVALARVLPCANDANGDPLTAEAWAAGGAFSECAAWGSAKVDSGPGFERIDGRLTAVGCGSSWASLTWRDGWKRPWPEPFDGYARVEVTIAC